MDYQPIRSGKYTQLNGLPLDIVHLFHMDLGGRYKDLYTDHYDMPRVLDILNLIYSLYLLDYIFCKDLLPFQVDNCIELCDYLLCMLLFEHKDF